MKQLKVISSLLIIVAMLMAAVPAKADGSVALESVTLTFTACTDNSPIDPGIGEAQMSVVVAQTATGVSFTFYNTSIELSSITDVYFDDGSLLKIATITSSAGVSFTDPATPSDLPGGNECDPAFEVSDSMSADSDPPHVMENGVNHSDEWLTIDFTLQDGQNFDDVIGELMTGLLRVGIHVQGFGDGFSESFVSGPPTAITLAAFGAKSSRGSVAVNWTTGTEIDNAGFNIYRSTSADGARTRLNSKLLAANGDAVSGASYSFSDASGYGSFYYWLEDVSYTGKATLHGPVLAVVTSPFRSPLYRPALPSR